MSGNAPRRGYLVLADISGFTAYLAATELEHAQGILTELLHLMVEKLTPTLTLSKIEGDALFAYAPQATLFRGETLLELIETTYVAFRDHVEGIRRGTTCQCNACRCIPMLDLKFVCHVGDYVVHQVVGSPELIGSDVNLAHRLLKNRVAEATGWHAYILFTDRCLAETGVQPDGAYEGVESVEHLGEVAVRAIDLRPRFETLTGARRVVVEPEEADMVSTFTLSAPPAIAWSWLNDPQKRAQWEEDAVTLIALPSGRSGVGRMSHCAHGKGVINETIRDWRPFEYFTVECTNIRYIHTYWLKPTPEGTEVTLAGRLLMPLPRFVRRAMLKSGSRQLEERAGRLKALVAVDVAEVAAPAAA